MICIGVEKVAVQFERTSRLVAEKVIRGQERN
jgi:hypothetical protein